MPFINIEHHHHYPNSDSSALMSLLHNTMERIMSQLDDLMSVLSAIHDDVIGVLDRAKNLEAQLTQLQQTTPPQVDLQPAIDVAAGIRAQLEGTAATTGEATSAEPTPAPASDSVSADVTSAPQDPAAGTGEQPA